jgi:hypothetical protein
MQFKEKVYRSFMTVLEEKILLLETTLADLKTSGALETKSTAGDKHETALAMLQIEQENKRKQLADAQQQLAVLKKINPAITPEIILNGSLIETDKGWFFISTALGKIVVEGKTIYALSASSPLGKELLKAKGNKKIVMNKIQYQIVSLQ